MSNNYFNFKKAIMAVLLLSIFNLSAQECTQPAAIFTAGKGMHYAKVSWTGLQTQPALGYDWQITADGNATVLQSGTANTNTVVVTGLVVETAYQLKVRSHCGTAVYSDWSVQNFTTLGLNSTQDGIIGSGADALALFGASYGPLMYAGIAQRNGSVANMLYTQTEMQSINIPNGAKITGVAFEKINNAVGGDAYPDLRLRMFAKNSTAAAPLSTTTTYGDILATHTEVTDNPAFDLPATIGWIDFPFEDKFTYNGGGFELATAMYQNGQTAQFSTWIVWQFTAGYKDYMVGAWPINTVPMSDNLILNHNSGGGQYKDRPNIKIYFELSNAPLNLYITTPNAVDPIITQNGGSLQLFTSVVPSHVSQEVLWQVTAGTENATVSANGLVTALANGTITLQAVSAEDATVLNTITVTITGQLAPVQSVTVEVEDNLAAAITEDNGTLQLSAAVLPANADQNVVWSIVSGSEYASVDTNGLITAINNGTATIQAVSAEDNTILDTIEITISNQVVAVNSVEVSITDNVAATITTDNGTLQLTALVLPSNSNQNVVWSIVSASGLATVDANGLVTALNNGTITVQAVSAEDNTILDTIEVVITNQNVAVASLEVSVTDNLPAAITTDNGTLQLSALVLPSNSNQNVVWSITSGLAYALVDANGLVTALDNGTATIQAVGAEDNTILDTIEVVMTNQIVAVASLEIIVADDAEAVITTNGGTLQLEAVILPLNSVQEVIWEVISGNAVATVDADGLVTAVTNGTVTIQAVSTENATITNTINIIVSGQVLGIDDFSRRDFIIYPNPSQDIITIQSKAEIRQITIYDIDGKKILENNGNTINIAALPQSNYILMATSIDGKTVSKKIVKK